MWLSVMKEIRALLVQQHHVTKSGCRCDWNVSRATKQVRRQQQQQQPKFYGLIEKGTEQARNLILEQKV